MYSSLFLLSLSALCSFDPGANLAEMAHLGLPVPAGFTISTEVCSYFVSHKDAFPVEFEGQVRVALAEVEKEMNCEFGSNENPLLLSVRSGARVSMPGMEKVVFVCSFHHDSFIAVFFLDKEKRKREEESERRGAKSLFLFSLSLFFSIFHFLFLLKFRLFVLLGRMK